MPHRDDNEAARARIDALQADLEEARRRADAAEASAREARAALAKVPPEPEKSKRVQKHEKHEREKKRAREARAAAHAATTASKPSWPDQSVARYRTLVGVVGAIAYAPAAFLFLASADALPLGALGIGLLVHLVLTYVIGRACDAPFPTSGVVVLLLVSGLFMMGLFLSTSDVLLGSFFSEGASRWVVRGALTLATLVVGGIVSGAWSADAARSELGRSRYYDRRS